MRSIDRFSNRIDRPSWRRVHAIKPGKSASLECEGRGDSRAPRDAIRVTVNANNTNANGLEVPQESERKLEVSKKERNVKKIR
jgi:hypothetical protein